MSIDSVFTALKSKRDRVVFKAGDVIFGLYRIAKWERCTIYEITDEGYNVWFHCDPVNEFRDIRRIDCTWAIAKLTKAQIEVSSETVTSPKTANSNSINLARVNDEEDASWYPCWVLDDEKSPAKWHVHLWWDIDSRRARTFLLPHSSIETGSGSARPINSDSWFNRCSSSCCIVS